MEVKYTECSNPQIKDQNWQSGLSNCASIPATASQEESVSLLAPEWPNPDRYHFFSIAMGNAIY